MRKILAKHGYEVWARWESEAEIFELFSDSDAVGYTCTSTGANASIRYSVANFGI